MIGRRTEPEYGQSRDWTRDRGVSVAITHVLTIGITTILIAMLMMSGSTLLETETERSADTALETIGERLADEIENVDRIGSDGNTDSVTLTVDHPRTVSNSGYTVRLVADCGTDDDSPLIEADDVDCLELETHNHDAIVYVPISETVTVDDGASATGGTIEITYDSGEVTIEGAN